MMGHDAGFTFLSRATMVYTSVRFGDKSRPCACDGGTTKPPFGGRRPPGWHSVSASGDVSSENGREGRAAMPDPLAPARRMWLAGALGVFGAYGAAGSQARRLCHTQPVALLALAPVSETTGPCSGSDGLTPGRVSRIQGSNLRTHSSVTSMFTLTSCGPAGIESTI